MMNSKNTSRCDEQRRSFLKLSGLLGLGAAATVVLPAAKAEAVLFGNREHKVSDTRLIMGSYLNITAIHASRDQAQHAIGLANEEIDRLCTLLSRHDSATPLSRLNAEGKLAGAPAEVLEVVARSLYLNRQTNGAFDITVKPVLDLYKSRFDAGKTPSEAEIAALLPRMGSEHIRFSAGNIGFGREGMGISLDGIAPGYIVDRAAQVLAANGVSNFLINASGDILASGTAEKGKPWTVAIQDPSKQKGYPDVVRLSKGAISTSGDYEIFYDQERLFHHIVDRRTGHSPTTLTSATVTASSCMDADALATALCVLQPAQAVALIDAMPGHGCYLIGRDGATSKSRSWQA
ncbi:MAG: FAD:protein FMN transferase [Thermodesulfobacteriota bacterium]